MSRGRRAVLPPARPLVSGEPGRRDQLVVSLTLEDDPSYCFDLARMAGPEQLRVGMGRAVLAWSSSARGGRRTHGVKGMRKGLSAFLRWVDGWNQKPKNDPSTYVGAVEDVTPFHLRQFRSHLDANHKKSTVYHYYGDAAVLLRHAPGVSKETWREAAKRKGDGPPPVKKMQRYTQSEVSRLRNGARKVVMTAHARIAPAYLVARDPDAAGSRDSMQAKALHEVLLYGRPRSKEGMSALGATVEAVEKRGGTNAARRHLFLTPDEMFAAIVLLCQWPVVSAHGRPVDVPAGGQ